MNIDAAYAKGSVTFMGVELGVAPGALVPRSETELLGETAARELSPAAGPVRIVDMCCGVGNLACALAVRLSTAQAWGCDLTARCVELANENVRRLRLQDRVQIVQGDLFGALAGQGLEGTIDAIVSAPPYISQKRLEGDRAPLLAHEPREAFDGGPYGLSIHQRIIREGAGFLREGGWLLFEVGLGQEKQVKMLMSRSRAFDEARFALDVDGHPRVVYARRTSG
jgi:release factor glutamine methyltransferase